MVESRERGPDPGDRVLLEWAGAEGGMIRLPDVPTDQRIRLMEKVLEDHGAELLKRAIVTVRGGRIRVSRVS